MAASIRTNFSVAVRVTSVSGCCGGSLGQGSPSFDYSQLFSARPAFSSLGASGFRVAEHLSGFSTGKSPINPRPLAIRRPIPSLGFPA